MTFILLMISSQNVREQPPLQARTGSRCKNESYAYMTGEILNKLSFALGRHYYIAMIHEGFFDLTDR
jgi:hypothetical protein